MIVITPARPQTSSSQPDPPMSRAISAETMKMPEPIIVPATSMVASNRPRRCSRPAAVTVRVRTGRSCEHTCAQWRRGCRQANKLTGADVNRLAACRESTSPALR